MNPQDSDQHHGPTDKQAEEKAKAKQAADLIRQRLDSLYEDEPNAKTESKEAEQAKHRSKHQQFMYDLTNSGKSLADIQTAWHEYYANLNEADKLEVWKEFYAANPDKSRTTTVVSKPDEKPKVIDKPVPPEKPQPEPQAPLVHHGTIEIKPPKPLPTPSHRTPSKTRHQRRSVSELKHQLITAKQRPHKLKARQHLQSLIFGLGLGSFVVLILLFSFFNERFIAPFISPSRHVSSTPIITDSTLTSAGPNPEVIIPKINVEIPVVYDEPSIQEAAVETALERGVVHYATTPSPGQQGNVVVFGHSSNNIFNPGKYKFAFVLLSRLENGDTFYLTKDSKLYVYKVYKKQIVQPNDVQVLSTADKPDTATLITCDPPGTSLHRLIVVGEQISPDPAGNGTSTAIKSDIKPTTIPSNSPSLWQRIKGWFTG